MREIRNAFLQQRIFYTEARLGQKFLGKNRASVFQGRHLLGPERFNLNTENTWAVENKKNRKWINVLLLAENCTFLVVDKCILNFAELLYLLAFLMKMPFRGDSGVPKGSHPVPAEAGAAWGLRFSLSTGVKVQTVWEEGIPALICWCHIGNSVTWKLSEGLARWTEHMDAVNCSRSSGFCLWIILNNVYLVHNPSSPLQRTGYPRSGCLSGQLDTFNE